MDTEALAVLVHAISSGSISAASRRLGLAPVVASRRLAALERDLGVRLMQRTTRSVSLTPEGEAFLPYAQDILDRQAAALATLTPGDTGATGLLRIAAPAALGRRIIVPLLPQLLADNPQMTLELHLAERFVDVVGEGFDAAIRIADLRDSTLIARRLGTVRRTLCASPDYVARCGRPSTISDLADHECLTLVGMTHWEFAAGSGKERVRIAGRMTSSTIDGLHAACLQGLGISMHASWSVDEDLKAGRLVPIELEAAPYAPAISALYPTARLVAPKLRVFLAALTAALASEARGEPVVSQARP